ncbi:MAG TPA: ATP-binding protein [Planctomycetota bacterium]|nr:ATP-binding protein [Planctomycetota bacterium]
MYFLDNTGFFSLVGLIIQCGLAWIFAAFFCLLSPGSSLWMWRWRAAFFGLGFALLAISVRFALAHYHLVGPSVIQEGDVRARVCYGIYLGGKAAFVWFLVGGLMALWQRPWPSRRWLPGLLIGGWAALGVSLPNVECALLAQAPGVALAFGYAARQLHKGGEQVVDVGRRTVRGVLAVWAVLWLIYGWAVLMVGPIHASTGSMWNVVLHLNSVADLSLQVVLASGLIVLVMQRAQQAALAAVQERDRLREQVRRDDRLRFQSTLVGGVAHELNNPLTAILGFAAELGAEDPEVRHKAARVVQEQAHRCRDIVRRMAELGRRHSFVSTDIDVAALVQRVARGFEHQLESAGVALELQVAPERRVVRADAAAIEQVLTNLLANALQASPRGARICIGAAYTTNQVVLRVDDQGPGVRREDRARIFEPFWTSKSTHGSGLGLAVAEALMQAHGGAIEVQDAPGGGARFLVTLPWQVAATRTEVLPPPAAASESRAQPGVARAPLAVLVVDDEPQVRSVISYFARSRGWKVVEAATGEQGLSLLLQPDRRFDAVVCDLRMPGMSGVDLHDEVDRKAPHLLRRFLFVTGNPGSPETVAFAARSGAAILAKPFDADDLLGRLHDLARAV